MSGTLMLRATALLSISLAGCASAPGDVGRTFAQGSGCFIVAWGEEHSNPTNRSSAVFFHAPGASSFGAFGYDSKVLSFLNDGVAFSDSQGHGMVRARYVSPGTYSLANPEIYLRNGPILYSQKPKVQTEIQFNVESGRCTYVGRFLLKGSDDKFVWTNRFSEDVGAVRQSIPAALAINPTPLVPRPVGGIVVLQ